MKDNMMKDDRIEDISPRVVKRANDLRVFQHAYNIALVIHKATLTFPAIEQSALANQLRRSSKSICANIAEGFPKQKYSKAEFMRYLAIAEGSAEETRVWLKFAVDLGYMSEKLYAECVEEYNFIIGMLVNLRSKVA